MLCHLMQNTGVAEMSKKIAVSEIAFILLSILF